AELEADIAGALRKMYFALSGRAPHNKWLEPKQPEARLLDGLVDPQPFPDWMSESDLAVYVDAFRAGGFRGPLNRYRAQTLDFTDLAELSGRGIAQPSAFIAGERDPVRASIPALAFSPTPELACSISRASTFFRGSEIWFRRGPQKRTT